MILTATVQIINYSSFCKVFLVHIQNRFNINDWAIIQNLSFYRKVFDLVGQRIVFWCKYIEPNTCKYMYLVGTTDICTYSFKVKKINFENAFHDHPRRLLPTCIQSVGIQCTRLAHSYPKLNPFYPHQLPLKPHSGILEIL